MILKERIARNIKKAIHTVKNIETSEIIFSYRDKEGDFINKQIEE